MKEINNCHQINCENLTKNIPNTVSHNYLDPPHSNVNSRKGGWHVKIKNEFSSYKKNIAIMAVWIGRLLRSLVVKRVIFSRNILTETHSVGGVSARFSVFTTPSGKGRHNVAEFTRSPAGSWRSVRKRSHGRPPILKKKKTSVKYTFFSFCERVKNNRKIKRTFTNNSVGNKMCARDWNWRQNDITRRSKSRDVQGAPPRFVRRTIYKNRNATAGHPVYTDRVICYTVCAHTKKYFGEVKVYTLHALPWMLNMFKLFH